MNFSRKRILRLRIEQKAFDAPLWMLVLRKKNPKGFYDLSGFILLYFPSAAIISSTLVNFTRGRPSG